MKEAILSTFDPDAPNPMLILSFVQEYVVPATLNVLAKLTTLVADPAQRV